MNRNLFKFATPPTPEQKKIAQNFYSVGHRYYENLNERVLGFGTFSVVFPLGNTKTLKVSRIAFRNRQNTNRTNKRKILESEIMRTKKASDKGIGPKFSRGFIHETDKEVFLLLETEKLKPIEDMINLEKLYDLMTKLKKSGMCHGDIHPGNLMMNSSGEYRFIDFALPERKNGCSNSEKLMEFFGVGSPPGTPVSVGSVNGSPMATFGTGLANNGSPVATFGTGLSTPPPVRKPKAARRLQAQTPPRA